MVKFSYIIPSILKFEYLKEQIEKIGNSSSVDEIIIINNSNGNNIPDFNTKANIIEIVPKEPCFCNGAWNLGVEMSKNDYIILSTDDLIYDNNIIDIVSTHIDKLPNLGLLGLDWNLHGEEESIFNNDIWFENAGTQREYGFGLMMFLNKINYTPIPYNIRHWYGDDYLYYIMLVKKLNNYIIKSNSFKIKTINGSMSSNNETQNRIKKDKEYWHNNYYDRFSIYGTRCG